MRDWMSLVDPAPSTIVVFIAVDRDLLGLAELRDLDLVQLKAQVLHDRLGAGEDRDILEHGLAAVAVAGGLDGTDLQHAAQLVDDQRRQSLRPSMSSAMISSGFFASITFSSNGTSF
jgi:hypothetical protein